MSQHYEIYEPDKDPYVTTAVRGKRFPAGTRVILVTDPDDDPIRQELVVEDGKVKRKVKATFGR